MRCEAESKNAWATVLQAAVDNTGSVLARVDHFRSALVDDGATIEHYRLGARGDRGIECVKVMLRDRHALTVAG